jgi:ubiquinone/menaquinone biosynthesis C-methylase UbiE
MTQQPDPETIRRQQKEEWNRVAPGWEKHDGRLRAATEPVTQRLLELADVRPGKRVLDVASGTGEPGLPAAHAVGPEGSVLLTDLAEEMLEAARRKAREQGLANVEFRLAGGEDLDLPENSFDAALCRWGLMFMPEPGRCLAGVHRALRPGGRFAVAVWGPPELNPFVAIPMGVLRKYVDVPPPQPGAPGIFAFADRGRLESVYAQAGFRDVHVEELEIAMAAFDSGYEFVDYILDIAGPAATLFARVPPGQQEQARREIASAAGGGDPDGPVALAGRPVLAAGAK